jgi:hypothetical protein
MFRTTLRAAGLVIGLLISLDLAAHAACEGDGCSATANAKPLNIMQFMREQAASTRVRKQASAIRAVKPRPSATQVIAKRPRAPYRVIAARKKPAPVPVEAAASFALPEQAPETPARGVPYNPFDRTADAAAAETTGAGITGAAEVQLVDAEELNDIDRKADTGRLLSADQAGSDATPSPTEQASVSWLRWIWSAVGSTFAALASAVHQLVGV